MKQLSLFEAIDKPLYTLKEASEWASKYLNRNVTISNLSYLIQYGRIKKYPNNGNTFVNINELKDYYDSISKEKHWKKILGKDLNWHLSFVEFKESERTKHVHRLHPYKGKFIPQLVEYFLDTHTDEFKKDLYFQKGDIVLDPFCGSGTTLIQANELGIHAIGIDISKFNSLISNVKVEKHDLNMLAENIRKLKFKLKEFQRTRNNVEFEQQLLSELSKFNSEYFPSPEYKRKLRRNEIDERSYSQKKEKEFLPVYKNLIDKFKIEVKQNKNSSFIDNWFLTPVREEIDFLFEEINKINNSDIKELIMIIFSRTIRSCRATTHADLATLKEPVTTTYYCKKHGKICKPIFSIMNWWNTYSYDTLRRFRKFDQLRTDSFQICLSGDSREIDIIEEVKNHEPSFAEILSCNKINGIFSSPPYVGLIDYHEQHAYSYELFKLKRNDDSEIGALSKGQGKDARDNYIKGIAEVLINCLQFLRTDFNIFLVANDKFNLYPKIAELSGMKIVNRFKRPVLNRVEKDRSAYSETIFLLKGN